MSDPACASWTHQWWDEAARHLPFHAAEISGYRDALVKRFTNPGIRHLLAQIAGDGSQKLRVRTVPVLLDERRQGRLPLGATRTLAAWTLHLRGVGAPVNDTEADVVVPLAAGRLPDAVLLRRPPTSTRSWPRTPLSRPP